MSLVYEALARSRNIRSELEIAPKPPVAHKIFRAARCLYTYQLKEYHKLEVNFPANGLVKDRLRTLK